MYRTVVLSLAAIGLLGACEPVTYGTDGDDIRQTGSVTVGQADMQAFCRGEVLETIADSPYITMGPVETTATGFSVLADELRGGTTANTYECRFDTSGGYQVVRKLTGPAEIDPAEIVIP